MLIERLKDYNIILASQSPRRRELLAKMCIEFTLSTPYKIDEVCPEGVEPEAEAWYLSKMKSEAYPEQLGDMDIVITSDTLVLVEETILGKPRDRDEAIKYLKMLSGRTHKVITGVTLRNKEIYHTFSVVTVVTMEMIKEEDIIYYVDNYSPYDKAGAYAIQEWIGAIAVSEISGSYYNIMGLPTVALYKQLNIFLDKI